MILVDYSGKPIGGTEAKHFHFRCPDSDIGTTWTGNINCPANAAGFLIHSAVHKARPDVVAACHTHSVHGMAWAGFAKPLEMLNQDIAYLYGNAQAVYEVRRTWRMSRQDG